MDPIHRTDCGTLRKCGRRGSRGLQNIVVAVKGEREISRSALVWALTHVVRQGDSITLLAVLSDGNRGRRFWSFPKLAGDCASGGDREDSPERMYRISERCSQMMLQFRGAFQNEINVRIKVASATPVGVVAAESKRAGAHWVILDKQLKQERKRCIEELQCNIVVMERSQAKVLRLNLLGSQEPDLPCSSSPEEELVGNRVKHSTPISSPEEAKTPFTRTTQASVSSFETENSPFFVCERNPLYEGIRKCDMNSVNEEFDSEDAVTAFGSDYEGSSPMSANHQSSVTQRRGSRDSSKFKLEQSRLSSSPSTTSSSTHSHNKVFWIQQNHIDELNPTIRNHSTKSPTTKSERRNGSDQEMSSWQSYRSHLKDYIFNSEVREAVSLYRHSPSIPPPLCSVCRHKAPIFGKPPRWFSYTELEDATSGFSEENFLAEGGFGLVHRGVLRDGQVVAVKRLKMSSSQGDAEFCAEVEVLSCAQHRNVVMLIGFCIEEKRRILVYEYICNGSLGYHLYGRCQTPLDWHARIKIAIGAARGLRYLHEDCRVGCIVHRDMRPNNILLTHDFEPLVGDFGLARWQPDGDLGVETRVIGTFGYLAPEYTESGRITEKADVFAFGLVLLELITGLKAVDLNRPKGQQLLVEWARPLLTAHEEGRIVAIDGLLDPRLSRDQLHSVSHQLRSMAHAASLCLKRDLHSRPRMSKVLRLLEGERPVNSAFDFDSVGNRSERLRRLSPRVFAEPGRSQSARLSHEALRAIYAERDRPMPMLPTGLSL
ncbi:inactive protein kinase SELMODRAFT_444075-like isoform X2 [Aristolochia californica]|uniref:inactive protein kinase SELMODRAFT_444075-like isoform X2 n=1 Tax=Aristolochia californica TaxID=171875 RepID=UPI0035E09710